MFVILQCVFIFSDTIVLPSVQISSRVILSGCILSGSFLQSCFKNGLISQYAGTRLARNSTNQTVTTSFRTTMTLA